MGPGNDPKTAIEAQLNYPFTMPSARVAVIIAVNVGDFAAIRRA
jgi:hypothetical protein